MTCNNVPTYCLPQKNSRKSFYSELSEFSDKLIKSVSKKEKQIIKHYTAFIRNNSAENIRDETEHMIEILIAGTLWKNYSATALKTKSIFFPIISLCKAQSDGKELVCASCSDLCNIGMVSTAMKKYSVKVYLIPHSSDFSRFLVKWKMNSDTGLVGVACVLNLLTGGYEMKRLGITSQCVFLNYCGCKKHWSKEGILTGININRLIELVK